jgi:alpha-glucosidase
VPLWPALEHTGEAPGALTLRVAVAAGAPEARTELYEDAGEGFGPSCRRSIICAAGDGAVIVRLGAREGTWAPARERTTLELRGVADADEVSLDGEPYEDWREEDGALLVAVDESPEARVLTFRMR